VDIIVSCAMCGKSFTGTVAMDDLNRSGERIVRDVIETQIKGTWLVQKNGDYVDVYCSKRCAE